MTLDHYKLAMLIVLLLALLALLAIHRGTSEWRFTDLLMTHKAGRPVADRQAFVLVGAFFVSSVWGTGLVLDGKLTEWFFIGYMVSFAGSHFGSRWLRVKEAGQGKAE